MARLSQKNSIATPPSTAEQITERQIDDGRSRRPPMSQVAPTPNRRASRPQSSTQVIEDSDEGISGGHGDDDDDRSMTLQADSPAYPPSHAERPAKRQRRHAVPRMLRGLKPENILRNSPGQKKNAAPLAMPASEVKHAGSDGGTRALPRRLARQKPVIYNMKIHPQDFALPGRRAAWSAFTGAEPDAAVEEDAATSSESEEHVEASDDAVSDRMHGLTVPEPHPDAIRHSQRSTARKPVNYNAKVHPNDADIGWPSRRSTTKDDRLGSQRRSAGEEQKVAADSGQADDASASEESLMSVRSASVPTEGSEHSEYLEEQHTSRPLVEQDDRLGNRDSSERSRSNTLESADYAYHNKASSQELGEVTGAIEDYLHAAAQATQPSPPPVMPSGRTRHVNDTLHDSELSDDEYVSGKVMSAKELSQLLKSPKPSKKSAMAKENKTPRRDRSMGKVRAEY